MTLMTEAAAAAPATAAPAAPAAAAPAAGGAPAAPEAGQTDASAAAGAPAAGAPAAGDAGAAGGETGQPGEKTDDQKAADEAAAKAAEEAAKAAGAPEKYEPFKAPEGAALDAEVITQFEQAARELNLPQDKAQQLIDKMAPVIAQQQIQQVEKFRTEWHAQSTADKEFGGDKLAENLGYANKALTAFASDDLKTFLKDSALGNHPEFVRFMVRAGKAMSEDKIVIGGATTAPRTAAEVLYGGGAKK
jgi:hypothetical protein